LQKKGAKSQTQTKDKGGESFHITERDSSPGREDGEGRECWTSRWSSTDRGEGKMGKEGMLPAKEKKDGKKRILRVAEKN